jgi:hypothetical protein
MDDLFAAFEADGMALRTLSVAPSDAVLAKSLLEAHPGLCTVVSAAERTGAGDVVLHIAATRELEGELDAVLAELAAELGLGLARRESRAGSGHGG